MDSSHGYEAISQAFVRGRSRDIGVREVNRWAKALRRGCSVLDLGCGCGLPLTAILVNEGFETFGIDASPSLVELFQRNLPGVPIRCEAVETSHFFERSFDAVLAWGLMFLLSAHAQRNLLTRISGVLVPKGRLLFTAPREPAVWSDAMTGLPSISLGQEEYGRQLACSGLAIREQYEDEGGNHYFDVVKLS